MHVVEPARWPLHLKDGHRLISICQELKGALVCVQVVEDGGGNLSELVDLLGGKAVDE
jgi:hypothetical protein